MNETRQSIFTETRCDLAGQLTEAALDHDAFERRLPICELTKCRATCCHDGVILSEEEAGILSSLGGAEGIVTMSDGRKKTATKDAVSEDLANDFPNHFSKTRCVFLDDSHRCQWQLRAVAEGRHPWFYKPTSCWLHPVLLTKREGRPLITIRAREDDETGFASHTPCGRVTEGAPPAWKSLAMELKMLGDISGRDFYSQMNAPPGFSVETNDCNSG